MGRFGFIVVFSTCSAVLPIARAAEPAVDFARDIQPILASRCTGCHGPDKQKGGLRLDRKTDAFTGGNNGQAIVSGKANESLLLKRIGATDDAKMPPDGERLTPAQIETLKVWIAGGASWPDDPAPKKSDWWSFQPLKKPATLKDRNTIDEAIRAEWKKKGLSASPKADRRTLIRRAYFDLHGLPPTPEQVDQFVKNDAPDAWEKLIDKLLASPRYGERWARYWLDVAHFGETHGYDKDKPRPNAWPYRDYVIRSLNDDKPYGRFVREQIAGDVLYPRTRDGVEALGFLSAGPWDFIGHVELPESKNDGKIARHLDRDDFVSNTISTFAGLTVHCAQCHNHKFDPITQEDYYRLQAVFAGIDRTEVAYDSDPSVTAKRSEYLAKKIDIGKKAKAMLESAAVKAGAELTDLDKQIAEGRKPVGGTKPEEHGYHSQISPERDVAKWVQIDLGESKKIETVFLRPCFDDFKNIGAGFGFPIRFKVELSDDADFKVGVSALADETEKDVANAGCSPYRVNANGKKGRYVRITATKLASRYRDYIFALAEVEIFDTGKGNLAKGKTVTALDTIEAPVRWSTGNLTDGKYPPEPKLSTVELAKLTEKRDAILKAALGDQWAADLEAFEAEAKHLESELSKLPPLSHVYVGAIHSGGGTFVGTGLNGGVPRTIHVLARGDITRPGKVVAPGTIAAVSGPKEFKLAEKHSEGNRRAALAQWLSDADNPLTWRVMANRVWQYHFGQGLVDTPNDFGKMGRAPTHPELLDSLAWEFREHQSLKKLHRRIMLSETYQQSSETNGANAKIDSENRYLWRQNRRKLEAEAVRDSILMVSGKLDLKMGGPSFQDFIVEKPEHSPHYEYQLHDPEDKASHRRTIYRFVVRSKPQPFLAALDCADPSLAVEKRNQTQSPQQALALLNNRFVLAMAQHFAARVEKLGKNEEERMAAAFDIAMGRKPTAKELALLATYAKEHGSANACRAILNLNEFSFVD